MKQLSSYMENIIRVVNQHAKLIDKVSEELDTRPRGVEVGEMFACLSQAYPYERSLKQLGMQMHPPRNQKVIEALDVHNVPFNLAFAAQTDCPIVNSWEGLDRFIKIIEVLGKVAVEAKEFQHSTEIQMKAMDENIKLRMLRSEFLTIYKTFKDKMKTKMKMNLEYMEEKIEKNRKDTEEMLLKMD